VGFFSLSVSNEYNLIVPAQQTRGVCQSLVARLLQTFHRTQEAGFAHELVEQALLLNQFLWRIELLDLTLVEYDDTIAV
jgi:hypothetical protein